MKPIIPVFLSLWIAAMAYGESGPDKATISGHIKDKNTGEDLNGATVYIRELSTGTATNDYGFYSISLDKNTYTLVFSYIGYEKEQQVINLHEDITLDVELSPSGTMLNAVEVVAAKEGETLRNPEMSVEKMESKTIREIPALFGEVDVIRALQLLPGVQFTSEGSTGFSVRGGSPDQNLVLLDEASVYNAGHLLGFFSVFNNDAIKEVTLHKGDIPPRFGGRLASVLDVRMKDGNKKKLSASGGIGLISSRLTVEGPLWKDKTSFILSGRRTYADLFLPWSGNNNIKDNKLYFYDLNAKLNHQINENNRIYISGYFGRDVFKNPFAAMKFGNQTATFRWNHLFSKKMFSNFTFVYSKYKYDLGTAEENEANAFVWYSSLEDYGLQGDFTYYANTANTLRFGIQSIYHNFDPGRAAGTGSNSLFTEFRQPRSHALETAVYVSNEQKITPLLTMRYGLRYSLFNNTGPSTVYRFDEHYEATGSDEYGKGEIYNTYMGLEPRLGVNYLLSEQSAVKGSYSRTFQYIQLAQNTTAGTPLDVWFPASPNVRPQIADQAALGYFRYFFRNTLKTSVEIYYKTMQNSIDFKDHANLLLNEKVEGELRFGKSWSYGAEIMVKLLALDLWKGTLNGWVSYTYSRAWRKVREINDGNKYAAPYDKPQDIAMVLNYEISEQLSFAANWIYQSGRPLTVPTGRAVIGGNIIPVYSDRNDFRYEPYHRLDISLTLRGKDTDKRFKHDWNFSVYNVYNRHNTWSLNFEQERSDPGNPDSGYNTYVEKVYLFGIIPSVTFNFYF